MSRLVQICFLFISLFFVTELQAQASFPFSEGERIKYDAYIEMPKAYISGVCVLQREGGIIKGSLFNEFGITALDFTYNPERGKVKLHHVMKLLDKWYIRRVLRKDMAQLMTCLQQGKTMYYNERRKIRYQLNDSPE